MSNTKRAERSRRIPIFENTEFFKASDVPLLKDNIQKEMDDIAESAIENQKNIIRTKLQNDRMKFEDLANDTIQKAWKSNQGDPEKLKAAFDSSRKPLMQSIPFALRSQAEHWFNSNTQGYLARAAQNEINILNDESKALIKNKIDKSFVKINETAPGLFSSDSVVNFQALESLGSLITSLKQDMDGVGADGLPLMSEVEQFKVFSKFKETALISGIRYHFNDLDNIEDKSKFLESFANRDLTIDFKDLSGNTEKINVINNLLTSGQHKSLVNEMRSTIEQDKALMRMLFLEDTFDKVQSGEAVPLSGLADYDKLVNDKFSEMIPGIVNSPDIVAVPQMINFFQKNGMPKSAVNMIKSWMDLGDENKVRKVVNVVTALEQQDPTSLSNLDGRELAMARDIARDLATGVSFDSSYDAAKGRYSPLTAERAKIIENEFNELTAGIDWDSEVRDAVSSFRFWKTDLTGAPEIDTHAIDEFRTLLRDQYRQTRNLKKALKNTKLFFANTWSKSIVNNGKLTKHPPERHYGIRGENNRWLRSQFEETLQPILQKLGITDPISLENSFIDADEITDAQVKAEVPPTYVIYIMEPSGSWFKVEDVRFSPNQTVVQEKINERNAVLVGIVPGIK